MRERKEDIPILAAHFIDIYKKEFDKDISFVTPEAMGVLVNYFWPGNVRELENVIYRAMIMTESECVDVRSLPDNIKDGTSKETGKAKSVSPQHSFIDGDTIDSFEESVRQTLQRALDLTNGDIPETAKKLKLSRSSFYRMVQKYGLTKPAPKN